MDIKKQNVEIETVLQKYGLKLVPEGDAFGTLRLYKNGQPTKLTYGCLLECAEGLVSYLKTGRLVSELQPLIQKALAQPFAWNAAAMIK